MYQSTIYVSSAKQIKSYSNSFSYCGATATGGVFTLLQTNLIDHSSTFTQNSGAMGGVINCQDANVTLVNSKFIFNFGNIGGVLSLQQYSIGTFSGANFT